MLNKEAHLNPDVFSKEVVQKPTRDGYGTGLVLAADRNDQVVALCADLTESTRTDAFAKKYPQRFIQVGVAEQAMATVAAGLAEAGKIAFIASYATFSPGRNWEQIRTTAAYNNANVKIAGHHAGISVGPDGATHQAIEDIATMRVIPRMCVIVPADAIEAEKATLAAAHIYGPVYLRFGREKTPVITTDHTPFTPGRVVTLWEGKKPQVAIIGCGALLHEALLAARTLEKEGIESLVINMHTIKPIDSAAILEAAKRCGAVVTVEEHNVLGGLGGAVAEVLAKHRPTPMAMVGMQDVFGESGQPHELIEKYGMDAAGIMRAVQSLVKAPKKKKA
jgi:transketolase